MKKWLGSDYSSRLSQRKVDQAVRLACTLSAIIEPDAPKLAPISLWFLSFLFDAPHEQAEARRWVERHLNIVKDVKGYAFPLVQSEAETLAERAKKDAQITAQGHDLASQLRGAK